MFKYISKIASLELETGLLMLRGVIMEFPKVLGESPSEVFFLSEDHTQRWRLSYNTGSFWTLCYNTGRAPTESYYLLDVVKNRLKCINGVKISNGYMTYFTNPNKIEILETYVPNLGNPILGKYVLKDL